MSEYKARIAWQRGDQDYAGNKYSRAHEWEFDGGLKVPASSAPGVVPVPMSVEENVDPEEAFVASLSSCHMLWFLAIAGKKRFVVDSYIDDAVGYLEKFEGNKMWMSKVVLRPRIIFGGDKQPSAEELEQLHEAAHENCYIANSVATEVVIES
ncbi:MAG: OsmC family protein [Gammaproteobacteria bacterium]|nr:OsmC family protein [Gammaproteobacteria bacterium]